LVLLCLCLLLNLLVAACPAHDAVLRIKHDDLGVLATYDEAGDVRVRKLVVIDLGAHLKPIVVHIATFLFSRLVFSVTECVLRYTVCSLPLGKLPCGARVGKMAE
jgi:hypothetical protein